MNSKAVKHLEEPLMYTSKWVRYLPIHTFSEEQIPDIWNSTVYYSELVEGSEGQIYRMQET